MEQVQIVQHQYERIRTRSQLIRQQGDHVSNQAGWIFLQHTKQVVSMPGAMVSVSGRHCEKGLGSLSPLSRE